MKHLTNFETLTDLNAKKSSLAKPNVSFVTEDSKVYITNNGFEAEVLMISLNGYQLYGEDMGDGEITYYTFEYVGTKEYEGKEYYEYSFMGAMSILTPTRNITKVTFPFEDYYFVTEEGIMPEAYMGIDSTYGYTSVPTNKVVIQHHDTSSLDKNGKDYVNLGLTSGTLWATMNVGASTETEYGKYFQWGDTVGYTDASHSSWGTYKYGDGDDLSKYNTGGINGYGGTIDNKITLDLSDDAAHTAMGGDWKMPTDAQLEELYSETDSEWVTDFNGSGINGRKFTSKSDPSKYIFIPSAGYAYYGSFNSRGSYGDVWSSSLYSSYPYSAWTLYFGSDGLSVSSNGRYCGFSVRGVL